VADEDIRRLLQAILDYFMGFKEAPEDLANKRVSERYGQILIDFVIFSNHNDIGWDDMFTFETFRDYRKRTHLRNTSHALIGLSTYLHDKGTIPQPLNSK
jgi:hypothetical protein